MTDEMRARFEAWVTSFPFERSVSRNPDDDSKYAWPGAYREYEVELAWEAWREATKQAGAMQ
jgi:hypothetical protein